MSLSKAAISTVLIVAGSRDRDRGQKLVAVLNSGYKAAYVDSEGEPELARRLSHEVDIVIHLDLTAVALAEATQAYQVYMPVSSGLSGCQTLEAAMTGWESECRLVRLAGLIITPDPETHEALRLVYGIPAERIRFAPDQLVGAMLTPARSSGAARWERLTIAFNDFPVHEVSSGGAARVRGFLASLGRPVLLLVLADMASILRLGPQFVQIAIPKSDAQRVEEQDCARIMGQSLSDIWGSVHAPLNPLLDAVLESVVHRADCLIFEHCYMASLLERVRLLSGAPVLYSSHNVEASLRDRLLAGHPHQGIIVQYISHLESELARSADLLISCSGEDVEHFGHLTGNVIHMPHGLERLRATAPGNAGTDTIRAGFIGSAHSPNVTALSFLTRELAPLFPAVQFEVVGSVCDVMTDDLPANVIRHGAVSDSRLDAITREWSIALNPITFGGGASVKLVDYLARGLPTLNTSFGARGYDIVRTESGIVAELKDWPDAFARLAGDAGLRAKLQLRAVELARHYLWEEVGRGVRARIEALALSTTSDPLPDPGEMRAPVPSSGPLTTTDIYGRARLLDELRDEPSLTLLVADPSSALARVRAAALSRSTDGTVILASETEAMIFRRANRPLRRGSGVSAILLSGSPVRSVIVSEHRLGEHGAAVDIAAALGVPVRIV